MLSRLTPIAEASRRGLHPRSIEGCEKIRRLLGCARENQCVFHRGLNRDVDLESAQLDRIDNDELIFEISNFEQDSRIQIFLNFRIEGRPYFFATTRADPINESRLATQISETIFYSERRNRPRCTPNGRAGDPHRVKLGFDRGEAVGGFVTDFLPDGLGLLVRSKSIATSSALLNLKFSTV